MSHLNDVVFKYYVFNYYCFGIYNLLTRTHSHLGVFLGSLEQSLILENIIEIVVIVVVTADRYTELPSKPAKKASDYRETTAQLSDKSNNLSSNFCFMDFICNLRFNRIAFRPISAD